MITRPQILRSTKIFTSSFFLYIFFATLINIPCGASPSHSLSEESHSPSLSLPVEKLSPPPPILPRRSIETAFTFTKLTPQLKSNLYNVELQDTTYSMPAFGAQIQGWLYRDYENSQHFGYILGTGIGDQKVYTRSKLQTFNTPVELLYTKLMAGVSFEKALWNDRFYLALNSLLLEELWQQNALQLGSRWSQWDPAFAISLQLKASLNQSWYALGEAHNHLPLNKNNFNSNNQRIYFGFGYCL